MKFEDNFSTQSRQYAQYRPRYPDALYAYFASIVAGHSFAWDCGTGNGQAAIGLAQHFERVYATDASAEQISRASSHARVEYHVGHAEHVELESSSVDLVTVAQAVHWFDLDNFYREVKRVLQPNGIFAVWTYGLPAISPQVDKVLHRFNAEVLDGFWSERVRYVEDEYRTLPFPFDEIVPPPFSMEARWNLGQLTGFLDSWSGSQKYREQKGKHPLEDVWDELSSAWKDDEEKRMIRWPLYFRIGKHT